MNKALDDSLISVIMPSFNSGKYISKSIDSVLWQTFSNWELIIIDDCSTDDSLFIAKKYAKLDDRIKVFKLKTNSGAAVARQTGIDNASGRYIAFIDSDDIWSVGKLSEQIKFMKENNAPISFSHYWIFKNKGNKFKIKEFKLKKDTLDYHDILLSNDIGNLTAIIDRNYIDNIVVPTNAPLREDLALWLSLLKTYNCKAYCIHKPLAYYRSHHSISSNKLKMIPLNFNVYYKVEKLSLLRSCFCLASWAIRGVLKSFSPFKNYSDPEKIL